MRVRINGLVGERGTTLQLGRGTKMPPGSSKAVCSGKQGAGYHFHNYRRRLQPNPPAAIRSAMSWGPKSVSLHRMILVTGWLSRQMCWAVHIKACLWPATHTASPLIPLLPEAFWLPGSFSMINTWQILFKFGVISFLQTTVGNLSFSKHPQNLILCKVIMTTLMCTF